MRIIAGDWRGTRLAALGKGDTRAHLRPTGDRVRESLFNRLAGGRFGAVLDNAEVLDLFAGTGALGLEALSRGAARAVFVESGRVGQDLIRRNISACRAEDRTQLVPRDATRPGPAPATPASLVFLDPPYGKGLGEKALAAHLGAGWIAPGALVVWEEDSTGPAPVPGTEVLATDRHGSTTLTFLRVI